MAIKVAINGFGRIGRQTAKYIMSDPNLELVAINDLTDAKSLAHLFKYDSVHGIYDGTVKVDGNAIVIGNKKIDIIAERDITKLPWAKYGVDVVIEATGVFKQKEQVQNHINNGAKKVLYSAPLKGADITIVLGVNDKDYDSSKHHIISNASCTTNCLAPVAKVLNDKFGIKNGLMTTIHSYTNDQKILDLPHSDLRRARAAGVSMIPTTTGAAKAIALVIPELTGKLDGFAMRVPTPNVSVVDLTVNLEKSTTVEELNAEMKKAAEGELKGYLEYCDLPLVSKDFNGNLSSSIFDSLMTNVIDGNSVKILSWYDNEAAYSKRLAELVGIVAKSL